MNKFKTAMLEHKPMHEFLLRIKCIVDVLGLYGDLVLPCEHLDTVLESLPEEYSLVIIVIKSKFEPFLIGEVNFRSALLIHL